MATLKLDVLVNGTSVLTSLATYTTAGGAVPAVFSKDWVPPGGIVTVKTEATSGSVVDVGGLLTVQGAFLAPLLLSALGTIAAGTHIHGFVAPPTGLKLVSLIPYARTA